MPVCLVTALMMFSMSVSPAATAEGAQTRFRSPEKAARALVDAARADDLKALLSILGPGGKRLISSGDSVADNASRDRFVIAYEQRHVLKPGAPGSMLLHVGTDDWSMPIPIVKKAKSWIFDIGKGEKEILNRRIGRNELNVIDAINAYVDAQHEYASKDCSGGGKVEFAQRFISSPGHRNGLYWEAGEGEPQSPLGPLIAQAAKDGYRPEGNLSPFHGYYFKILKGQGKHAEGGAYRYMVRDKMILGFALVAYPAEFGNSGVMTFMVNQEGVVYEKNLGKKTGRLAESITVYNPDKSWKKVKGQEKTAENKQDSTGAMKER